MLVKIKLKTGYTDRYGSEHAFGETWDAPDAIGAKLLANGIAERAPAPAPETTAKAAPEAAVKPAARTRTKKV